MYQRPMKRVRRFSYTQKKRPSINIDAFIKQASAVKAATPEVVIKHTFNDFALDARVKEAITQKGYTTPTPIQDQAIPVVLEGKDVVGLAATGTGKTGAFLLPLISRIMEYKIKKVLILAPTRELALQIDAEFKGFTKGLRMYSAVCVGGMPIYRQIDSLRRGVDIIIGTPGRIEDLAERGEINFAECDAVVLDEVDHMLDLGFIEPITRIMKQVAPERQTLFFSATMPPKIRNLVTDFLRTPVVIEITSGVSSANVEQSIIRVPEASRKFEHLHDILSTDECEKVLIFSETKRDVEQLTVALQKKGHKAVSIHGDKRQRERNRALSDFSNNTVNILVATSVAARGLDIKKVTHVINYTVPQSYDEYIHRIGRTGRGSHKGKAFTFV